MRGEAGLWLKIAERTGLSPARAKEEHTVSDFLDWQAYFEEELTGTSKLDRQLARLTYYIHLVFLAVLHQKPDGKTEDDFLIKYERTGPVAKPDPIPQPVQPNGKRYDPKKVAASKAAWLTATGFRKPGDKKPPVVRRMPPKKKGK